jgi:UDP-N-acetylglucosamine acyltransferase
MQAHGRQEASSLLPRGGFSMNAACSTRIHPTAVIHQGAVIGQDVEIGPYSLIHDHVSIGDGCCIGSHVIIHERSTIGAGNRIYSGAVIGQVPQDLKYNGEETYLTIGHGNTIREYATISVGTEHGGSYTIIGDGNLIMSYTHIGHDCRIGNQTIISNSTQLAGHVKVEDHAVMGGMCGIHQFCRIGTMAMVGARTKITKDVPPYMLVEGDPARLFGLNVTGLRRGGLQAETMKRLKEAYQVLFRSGLPIGQALLRLGELEPLEQIDVLRSFVERSQRGIISRSVAS